MSKDARLKYYRRFTDDRNRALEHIKDKYEARINDELRRCFMVMAEVYLSNTRTNILDFVIHDTAMKIGKLIGEMRHSVYVLTLNSEAEVLGRVTDHSSHVKTHGIHGALAKESPAGGHWFGRVSLYLKKIVRKLDALKDLAELTKEKLTPEELKSAFPKIKGLARAADLMRLHEVKKTAQELEDENLDYTIDETSEIEWDRIVDDYLGDYVPSNRGPDSYWTDEEMLDAGSFPADRYADRTYEWELENDLTEDFVKTVRDGQYDAANQNGIVDFVWVAVLDSKTDDCCIWRNGLTTSEIETQLEDKHADDECQVTTVPAHFNCRCSLAPATEDLPDAPMSNKGSFDEWLNN